MNESVPPAQRPPEPLRVLIVEDETIPAMGLCAQLTKLGHNVVGTAAHATEARTLYRTEHPDLALLDIRLGEDDGLELAGELLKERRCPMIVLSAFQRHATHPPRRRSGRLRVSDQTRQPRGACRPDRGHCRCFRDQERLRLEKDHLAQTLETRKLLEKAKGIFMKRLNLDEPEAHRRLQQESQKRRIGMAELAKKIIESEELLGG